MVVIAFHPAAGVSLPVVHMRIINQQRLCIPLATVRLKGEMAVPKNAHALIIFCNGSGDRHIPANETVECLHDHGFATLVFDMLTEDENNNYLNRFNITLLADRLKQVTRWIMKRADCSSLRIGYFGAGTGTAAAFSAAAELPQIGAIVSHGGRPDLAMDSLPFIKVPVLLIVGQPDTEVLKMNEKALLALQCQKKMEVIPEASHLFEEKETKEKVSVLAATWFEMYLQPLELYESYNY